jgi:hypothetical protein
MASCAVRSIQAYCRGVPEKKLPRSGSFQISQSRIVGSARRTIAVISAR